MSNNNGSPRSNAGSYDMPSNNEERTPSPRAEAAAAARRHEIAVKAALDTDGAMRLYFNSRAMGEGEEYHDLIAQNAFGESLPPATYRVLIRDRASDRGVNPMYAYIVIIVAGETNIARRRRAQNRNRTPSPPRPAPVGGRKIKRKTRKARSSRRRN
jgi:hypothetical protein